MTKKVRITNADSSTHPLRVTVQEMNEEGVWVDVTSTQINWPADQLTEYVNRGKRRLVVEEESAPEERPVKPV